MAADDGHLPTLKAVILDFSSVNNVDITSVQHLIDVRNQLDRYTSPEKVQWHFAYINNRWTRRALASAGFGYPTPEDGVFSRWKPIFSVADMGGSTSAAADAEYTLNKQETRRQHDIEEIRSHSVARERELEGFASGSSSGRNSIEKAINHSKAYGAEQSKVVVVHGLNRPFFHIDLTSALQSTIANLHDPIELETADNTVVDDQKDHAYVS